MGKNSVTSLTSRKNSGGRLAWRSTIAARDIVFLPRHELRNKIATRNWNYPRITIARGWSQALPPVCVCVCVCVDTEKAERSSGINGRETRTRVSLLPRLTAAGVLNTFGIDCFASIVQSAEIPALRRFFTALKSRETRAKPTETGTYTGSLFSELRETVPKRSQTRSSFHFFFLLSLSLPHTHTHTHVHTHPLFIFHGRIPKRDGPRTMRSHFHLYSRAGNL